MVRNCPRNKKNNSQVFGEKLTGLGEFLCLLVDSHAIQSHTVQMCVLNEHVPITV